MADNMAEVNSNPSSSGLNTGSDSSGREAGFFGGILEVLNFAGFASGVKSQSFIFSIIFIASISLILIPLPGVFLDFFMIMNMILSLVILITIVNTKNNLEFSIFPTILLWSTLFRLVVNVSSTRLILSKGIAFDGNVVRAFSDFVSGGSFLIGAIIFIIIITVQFLVITRGASRASEVSARFRLDSLPGKQMAIDADLSSGVIDEIEAVKRRDVVQQEADFYGSMDGASKFINGEVIASIVIVFINIIGGILTGTVVHGESLSESVESYLKFAIGDGLVAAIPSLVIAISSGIVVTRTISKNNIAEDVFSQLFNNSTIFYILAGFVALMAFLPGFPAMVLMPTGLLILFLAYYLQKKKQSEESQQIDEDISIEPEGELTIEKIAEGIQIDPIEIELGYELIVFADPSQGGDLAERVKNSRRQLALDLGMVIPQVRMSDNMQLQRNHYQIKINGSVVGQADLQPSRLLAIDSTGTNQVLEGHDKVKDPTFGITSYWVNEEEKDALEKRGFTIADVPTIVTTHLVELIKENASEVLGRKEIQAILDSVKKVDSILIEEVMKVENPINLVQKVFTGLLEEGISIRNTKSILEAICDFDRSGISQEDLIERVRQRLKLKICETYGDVYKNINVITMGNEWETKVLAAVNQTEQGRFINLDPATMKEFLLQLQEVAAKVSETGYVPILITDEYLRRPLRNIIRKNFKDLKIIAHQEIADGFKINIVESLSA